MTAPVIAGVDGSPSSEVAARHAAMAARRLGAPLRLVHGYPNPFTYALPLDPYAMGLPEVSKAAGDMLAAFAENLRRDFPDLSIEAVEEPGGGAGVLVEQSRDASVVVVGNRGHGGFAGLNLGSVSAQIIAHAHCPTLVVRPPDCPVDAPGPVVVGTDGSEDALVAVRAAAVEAAGRDVPLRIIHAWWGDPVLVSPTSDVERESAGRQKAQEVVDAAVAAATEVRPDLVVEGIAEHSLNPEYTMVEASRAAAIVVTGSHGRGGFTGLLLGSVSQALAHHAACPVLVVPTRSRA
ncbi:universal stress protein [Pilimelia columellifera]|uniref:Universal stress protein n=1 Tax=Pilimelia columellifera subsp. columellifera TaxID=706583 RepID=A0ABN3NN42_9ACTN